MFFFKVKGEASIWMIIIAQKCLDRKKEKKDWWLIALNSSNIYVNSTTQHHLIIANTVYEWI